MLPNFPMDESDFFPWKRCEIAVGTRTGRRNTCQVKFRTFFLAKIEVEEISHQALIIIHLDLSLQQSSKKQFRVHS